MVTPSSNGQPRAGSRSRASRLSYVLDLKNKEANFIERPALRKNATFSTASTSVATNASDKSRDEEATQKRRMVIRSKLERFNNPINSVSTPIAAKKQNLKLEQAVPLEKLPKINQSPRQRMAYFAELNRRRQTGYARKKMSPRSNPPQDREDGKEEEEKEAKSTEEEMIREESSVEEISEKSESIVNESIAQEESIEDSISEYDQTKTMTSRRETTSSRESSSLIGKSASFAAVKKVVEKVQNMSEGESDIILSISGDLFSNEEKKGTPKSSSRPRLSPSINRRSAYLEKLAKSKKEKPNPERNTARKKLPPSQNVDPEAHDENRRYDKGYLEQDYIEKSKVTEESIVEIGEDARSDKGYLEQDYIEKSKVTEESIVEVGEDARSQVSSRSNNIQGSQSNNAENEHRNDQIVDDREDHASILSIESKASHSTFLEDTLKEMNVDGAMLAKILDIEKNQNADLSLYSPSPRSGKEKKGPIQRKAYCQQSPSPSHRERMSDMHITSTRTSDSSDTVKAAKDIIQWRQMSPRSTRSPRHRDAMIVSPSFEKKLNRKYPSFSPPERIYRHPKPDSLAKSHDLSHHSIDRVSGNTLSTKSGNIRRGRPFNEVYRPFRPVGGSFYENAPRSAVSNYAATNTGPLQDEIPQYNVSGKEVEARESSHRHQLRSMASIQREEDDEPVQFNKVLRTRRVDHYSTSELSIGHGMPPRISRMKENKNEVLIARPNTNSNDHVLKSFDSVESSIYSSCSDGIESIAVTLKEGSKVVLPISCSPEDEVQSKSRSKHQNQLQSHAGARRTRSEESFNSTKSATTWKVIVDRGATKASKFVSLTPSSLTTESLGSSSTEYSSRSSSSTIEKSCSMSEEPTFSDDSSLLDEKAPTDSVFCAFPSRAIAVFGSFMK
eukprot:CAMPEP_0194096014 /NCGR_PEP_ID=MMETSP0149-20130528/57127_1 /TAXON_ID=122233 /ORGANISM="Chaetoceros debilis, Strain MM31A-1" /LENGTH=898 /DNA_ID=CAMNT_0038781979 /DNA_START=1 /DNA_END=2697 /DNA_ORIENTATION=-